MKTVYEKPVLNKLYGGMMNKFGASPAYARKVRESIDGVSIDALVEEYGSPLFVYSERSLRQKYRSMHTAFSTRYPNMVFGWSYKTAYLSAICATFHQEGAIAEVVSEMEYEKALALGMPARKIVFNGPHKPMPVLKKAAADGATINVDHMDEIRDLDAIAGELNRKIEVGIRINLDAGIYPQWSRFGFNLESGQALEAARRIAASGRLAVNGIHCHIGTFITDPAAYARQIEKMVGLAYDLESRFKFSIDYLDIGGGFPSRSRLKGTYLPPETAVPPVDEYAEQVAGALNRFLRPGDYPRLILEAGRALVDEAGYLISTVVGAKRLADGARAYVMDGGVNLLYTSNWYRFNIETDRPVGGVNEPSVLCGPLCMNIDVLDDGALLPPLNRGTRLIFSPVGAYNTTQWMQFIHYRPNVVLIGESGQVDVIREAEDLSDISRRERLPERLRKVEQS